MDVQPLCLAEGNFISFHDYRQGQGSMSPKRARPKRSMSDERGPSEWTHCRSLLQPQPRKRCLNWLKPEEFSRVHYPLTNYMIVCVMIESLIESLFFSQIRSLWAILLLENIWVIYSLSLLRGTLVSVSSHFSQLSLLWISPPLGYFGILLLWASSSSSSSSASPAFFSGPFLLWPDLDIFFLLYLIIMISITSIYWNFLLLLLFLELPSFGAGIFSDLSATSQGRISLGLPLTVDLNIQWASAPPIKKCCKSMKKSENTLKWSQILRGISSSVKEA